MSELGGEKIDIIEWSADTKKFIEDALSPAKVISIALDEKNNQATAMVSEDQQSLAIGKGGQNVRLAAKLTGWKIDIRHPNAPRPDAERPSADVDDLSNESDAEIGISDTDIESGPRPSLIDSDERI